MAEEEQPLPFHSDHPFQLWSYSKSHATLVLRGRPGETYDRYVDLVFTEVLGMKVTTGYRGLSVVSAADTSEMDDFLQKPGRYERGFLNLDVSDGIHKGFVVCKRVRVRRGTGWQDPA
ncbi:hypothetical protein ACF059_24620 [Streptomyces sp. NPDC016562]|uniref:hypothetical protein n=1 Tax=Streptomyces sp. NPDC016562 TaxID=3364966 RepID=UPI0036FB91BB